MTAIKNYSGSSSKGFKELDEAKEWLNGDYSLNLTNTYSEIESLKKENLACKNYYAISNGRIVGITTSEKKYLSATKNYPKAKSNIFKSKSAAISWLKRQGISPINKKGIYAIASGWRTGVFSYLNTFEKNMNGYPNSLGRSGFATVEDALEWVKKNKISSTKKTEYFAIALGKRTGIFSKEETYLRNIQGQKQSWSKRGFSTKKEARKWLDLCRCLIKNGSLDQGEKKKAIIDPEKLPIVYIDGSYYSNQKKYGSSVVICHPDGGLDTFAHSRQYHSNNTFAEVEALYYCIKLMAYIYDIKEYILVYDHENLNRIAWGEIQIKSISKKLQQKIVQEIAVNQPIIHFLKVKSHSYFSGNILADKLAKESVKRLDQNH